MTGSPGVNLGTNLKDAEVSGRPGAGAVLAAGMAAEADHRPRGHDLRPLSRLAPFVRAHWPDAALAGLFLLLSTSATTGLTFALRWMADRGIASHSASLIGRYFGVLAVVDLRGALYGHVMNLDQAFFLTIRTGEVLSRMTTDLTIVESMVGSTTSVALRNFLTVTLALIVLVIVNPALTAFVALLAVLILAPLFVVGRRVRRLSVHAQ